MQVFIFVSCINCKWKETVVTLWGQSHWRAAPSTANKSMSECCESIVQTKKKNTIVENWQLAKTAPPHLVAVRYNLTTALSYLRIVTISYFNAKSEACQNPKPAVSPLAAPSLFLLPSSSLTFASSSTYLPPTGELEGDEARTCLLLLHACTVHAGVFLVNDVLQSRHKRPSSCPCLPCVSNCESQKHVPY